MRHVGAMALRDEVRIRHAIDIDEDLGGKGFVQLPDVDILEFQPVLRQKARDGHGRAKQHFVLQAVDAAQQMVAHQGHRTELPACRFLLTRQQQRAGPVSEARGVAGGNDAVRRVEDGLQSRQALDTGVLARAVVVLGKRTGLVAHGRDLAGVPPIVSGGNGTRVRFGGVVVGSLAGGAVALDHAFASFAHGQASGVVAALRDFQCEIARPQRRQHLEAFPKLLALAQLHQAAADVL